MLMRARICMVVGPFGVGCLSVRSEPIATSRHGSMPSLLAHPDYTRERVRQVARRVAALVHADARAPERLRIAGPLDRIAASEAAALDYRDAEPGGMALGPLWATWWLAVDGRVPAEWEGEQVDLLLVTNSEATLWLDGEPGQGLGSGGADVCPH